MSVVRITEIKDVKDVLHILEYTADGRTETHEKAVRVHVKASDKAYAGTVDGDVVCIWGVIRQSLLSDRGYIWLLTTDRAEDHKFLLIRYSQRIIERLKDNYTVLCGECRLGDYKAMKWMRLLGAHFSEPGSQTIPFQIER